MTRPISRLLLSLCLTAGLAACSSPGGRDGGPGGPGGGSGRGGESGGMEDRRGGSSSGSQSVVDQIQTQLRDTAEELKLTPKQVPLWETYQEKVGALMADMLRIEAYQRPNQTAPQLIAAKVNTVRNRLTAMEDIADSANKLYLTLDDTQKKVADRRLANTVPALYSGLNCSRGNEGSASGRGGMGGGMGGPGGGMGGPGGGMGGGIGRY